MARGLAPAPWPLLVPGPLRVAPALAGGRAALPAAGPFLCEGLSLGTDSYRGEQQRQS